MKKKLVHPKNQSKNKLCFRPHLKGSPHLLSKDNGIKLKASYVLVFRAHNMINTNQIKEITFCFQPVGCKLCGVKRPKGTKFSLKEI